MPPLIEFNVKAKPQMATAFGGVLEPGHYYKLRNGMVIKIVPHDPKIADVDWRCGVFVTGALVPSEKWWLKDGLFQGMEFVFDYKYHVHAECEAPGTELTLQMGKQYITKGGLKTTKMELSQVHNHDVGGPVFAAYLMKPDGSLSLQCKYNMYGLYLGSLNKIGWPGGNKDSARTIVAAVLDWNGP